MQDQLTDHLDQQLKSTSLENFSDYLKNLQDIFLCLYAGKLHINAGSMII